jgi:hypothetical protein
LRTGAAGERSADILHFARPLIGSRGDQLAQALRGVGKALEHFEKHRA